MLVVAVGDRKKIEADMAKLNLGAIEYRDADGNVITATGSGGAAR
jgi:hypothetical protein